MQRNELKRKDDLIRAFIAIEIPEKIKNELCLIQEKIKDFRCIKTVDRNHIHITINFLGNIEYNNLISIGNIIEQTRIKKAEIHIKGLGFFPSINYARVLWAGVYGIEDIANTIYEKIKYGSKIDKGHATIARIKCRPEKMFFQEVSKYAMNDFGHFDAEEIVIFKSTLTRQGPAYEKITAIKLN